MKQKVTASHTKGPWEAHSGEVTTQQIAGRSYRRIAVIQDYGVGSLKEIDEANAQLIAAAPDLLEALEEALDNFLECNCGKSCEGTCTYSRAKRAIAKASAE